MCIFIYMCILYHIFYAMTYFYSKLTSGPLIPFTHIYTYIYTTKHETYYQRFYFVRINSSYSYYRSAICNNIA